MPVCAAWIGLKPCFVKEVGFKMRLPAVAVAATLMNDFSQNTDNKYRQLLDFSTWRRKRQ